MKTKILDEFKGKKPTLDLYKDRVINLLVDLLKENTILIHQINGRTKDFESLGKKIDRKQGKYTSLGDITDLVGIRIITYLESEVDTVADLIRIEFCEDKPNSTDKRILKSNQFGYKSLHIVCSLNDKRNALTEYNPYKDIKCEIQIRSILQHAWAEIEHDLGYKGKAAIPEVYVRDFNRLAALLETADKEFDRLKGDLLKYEKEILTLIKEEPQNIELNQTSLNSLISTNSVFQNANSIIAKNTGAAFYEDTDTSGIIGRFKLFKIDTIKELEDSLIENEKTFLAFVNEFTDKLLYDELSVGLCLFYFQHFLASKTEDPEFVKAYFNHEEPHIGSDPNTPQNFVDMYVKVKSLID